MRQLLKQWNQLLVEPNETRWRGCKECKEKVFDLDGVSVQAAMDLLLNRWSNACVHVSEISTNVIFLKDRNEVHRFWGRPIRTISASSPHGGRCQSDRRKCRIRPQSTRDPHIVCRDA